MYKKSIQMLQNTILYALKGHRLESIVYYRFINYTIGMFNETYLGSSIYCIGISPRLVLGSGCLSEKFTRLPTTENINHR